MNSRGRMSIFKTELAKAVRRMSDKDLLELIATHLNGAKPKRKYTKRAKVVIKKARKKRRA